MNRKVFLAGATGVIGTALVPLLIDAGYTVYGGTRRPERAASLEAAGAVPVVVDVFDRDALAAALARIAPSGVVHQLSDLPPGLDPSKMAQALVNNARVRDEGTRNLVAAGGLGEIRQTRATYLQDWLVDENAPLTWRLDKSLAGSGSLGDIGAHAIDMIQYLTGTTVDAVSGTLATFVTERPLLGDTRGLGGTASGDGREVQRGPVTVDDAAWFTGRLSSGVIGSFEATRFATGRKNAFRFEISGSLGAIAFDMESMNELQFYDATAPAGGRGFTRIIATEPEHPYAANWWPTGHALGYEHAFSHEVVDFVTDIVAGRDPEPSFADGLQVQRVLAAVEHSAAHGSAWTACE